MKKNVNKREIIGKLLIILSFLQVLIFIKETQIIRETKIRTAAIVTYAGVPHDEDGFGKNKKQNVKIKYLENYDNFEFHEKFFHDESVKEPYKKDQLIIVTVDINDINNVNLEPITHGNLLYLFMFLVMFILGMIILFKQKKTN